MSRNPTFEASTTRWSANGVACLRAAAYLDEREARHADHHAVEFVEGVPGILATTPGVRRLASSIFNWFVPGVYYSHIARTRFFDEQVLGAIRSGTQQLVVLGAGLDSRAYRIAGSGVRCFEVDRPQNAARKRARVLRTLGRLPPHVSYVSADLADVPALRDGLHSSAFDPSLPAVVLLEGVTMYLSSAALDALLGWVASLAPGSLLLIDYFYPSITEPKVLGRRMRSHVRAMARRAEPYTLGLHPSEVPARVGRYNLEASEVFDHRELRTRYLTPSSGAPPIGHPMSVHGVAVVRHPLADK